MKVRAVVNPRAGVAARRVIEALEGQRFWRHLEIRITEGPRHAIDLAREAVDVGCEVVLACGGDGTANEVAKGILGTGALFGVIPVGSGNGLARNLRIPLTPHRALQALSRAQIRKMDVGFVNGQPFLNVAGVGFDAEIGEAFHAWGRERRRGILHYVRLAATRFLTYPAPLLRLVADDYESHGPVFLVAFANGRQYGAGAEVVPDSTLDDGTFEVVVLEDRPRAVMATGVAHLFLGGVEAIPGYRRIRTRSALITATTPVPVHRDGEPEPRVERVEVTLRPRALPILVPRATLADPWGPFTAE